MPDLVPLRPSEACKRACRYRYYLHLRDRIRKEMDLCKEHNKPLPKHLEGLSVEAIDNLIVRALGAFEVRKQISCQDMLNPPLFFRSALL